MKRLLLELTRLALLLIVSVFVTPQLSAFAMGPLAECTPPADEYFGTLSPDGVCHPLDKSVAKFFDRNNDCTPDPQDRGTLQVRFSPPEYALTYECKLPDADVPGCTPPAEDYGGMWGNDGKCHPIRKSRFINVNDCTPDLKGRGTLTYSPLYAKRDGSERLYMKYDPTCVIISKPLRRSRSIQQQLDELRDEMDQLKSER